MGSRFSTGQKPEAHAGGPGGEHNEITELPAWDGMLFSAPHTNRWVSGDSGSFPKPYENDKMIFLLAHQSFLDISSHYHVTKEVFRA
jgi:hypothetical protein